MLGWILVALGGAALLAFGYASLIERNWFALRRHIVACLPPGSPRLRILHLSDLHLRAGQRRKRAFIESCADLSPDVVVGTGDYLGDDRSAAAVVETLAAIKPRLGALFVLGSNDYYGARPKNPFGYFRKRRGPFRAGIPNTTWQQMVTGLQEAGWQLISNRAMRLGDVEVVGLDDPHIRRHELTVATARAGGGFRLAVVHSPDVAADLAALGYDLVLCGHTHGGQVRIPGVGALVTNSAIPRAMARGVHRLGEARLHVNAGLGTSMYAPFRFACRPEICLLECVPRE